MQRVLGKRIFRQLKENLFRYLALSALIILGMYLVISMVGAAETVNLSFPVSEVLRITMLHTKSWATSYVTVISLEQHLSLMNNGIGCSGAETRNLL